MSASIVKPSSLTRCPSIRGYLLHLTHYDPVWMRKKAREKPFELDVALEIVEALAAQGFNTLLIGVSDGVQYKSHPELTRHYSVPMKQLRTLAARARKLGMDIVPKLNFSRSLINGHDHWTHAPGDRWHTHFDDEYYWNLAFDCIDEVIAACEPARYFHVGMDEDHQRSYGQYVEASRILRAGLKSRGLRMVCWSDSAINYPSAFIHREKSEWAEEKLPHDSVRLLWTYRRVPTKEIKRIGKLGFELWGAPGTDPKLVRGFRDTLLAAGGNGLVMTRWVPCRKRNRAEILRLIRDLGPIYRGE